MAEQTASFSERNPVFAGSAAGPADISYRHRDELSPGGQQRTDSLYRQIRTGLRSLGVATLDELAAGIREKTISPEQARTVLMQMKRLETATEPGFPYEMTMVHLERPENPDITRVVFLPDSTIAIRSTTVDSKVSQFMSVVDPVTNQTLGKPIRVKFGRSRDITALPDGRIISYGCNAIWKPKTGQRKPIFPEDSPYNAKDGNMMTRILKHPAGSLVFVNGGLGPGAPDFDVITYKPESAEAANVPLPDLGFVPQFLQDITPEGYYLMQSVHSGHSPQLKKNLSYAAISAWDSGVKKEIYALHIPIGNDNVPVAVKAMPDSSALLIATKTTLHAWERTSGLLTDICIPDTYSEIRAVEFFPPNPRYAYVFGINKDQHSDPYTLLLVDLEFNQVVRTIPSNKKYFFTSPDGRVCLAKGTGIDLYSFTEKQP